MALSVLGQRRSRLVLVALFVAAVLVYLGFRQSSERPDFFQSDLFQPDAPAPGGPQGAPLADAAKAAGDNGCVPFVQWMNTMPGPESRGKRRFPFVRPPPKCRAFKLPALEALLERMRGVIRDPDLFRLFENSYPMTLDTMVRWRGYANRTDETTGESTPTDEELAYVITGDIDAMWLRDSASQIYSYLPLLEPSADPDSLASLWRGLINAHARFIRISPYCHSFQPPPESGVPPTFNPAYAQNNPNPPYDRDKVFDCKWELDSLASFLQISVAYFRATDDLDFFGRYAWVDAVAAALDAAGAMRRGTYAPDGRVLPSAWTFTGWTNRGSETLTNDGLGNPVRENGMVRSAFRPSDDACIFQLLTPANMMWAAYLDHASDIMVRLRKAHPRAPALAAEMRAQAAGIRRGIDRDAVVAHRDFGPLFAYEVDGFGGANLMDDANIPSLLAMPLWNYTEPSGNQFAKYGYNGTTKGRARDTEEGTERKEEGGKEAPDYDRIYRNTRAFVLSDANPYFARGPVISAVGGPHTGPGKAWPMAAIVAALTAYEPASGLSDPSAEVADQLRMVLDSTSGAGVVHESINSWADRQFTRPWFGWASGLFGELILRVEAEEERRGITGDASLLGRSWQ